MYRYLKCPDYTLLRQCITTLPTPNPSNQTVQSYLFSEPYKTLNKVGHALHMEPGPFQDIVTCDRTKKLLKALGYNQVSIPQRIRSYQSPR